MIPNPAPSAPSRWSSPTRTFSAVTWHESLPRRPRPSKFDSKRMPEDFAGTSHSVLSSLPADGLLDHT